MISPVWELKFRERRCWDQTNASSWGDACPGLQPVWILGWEWGPCGPWIGGAQGMGFSGTQCWGIPGFWEFGACWDNQEALQWSEDTHRSIPGISLFRTAEGTRGRREWVRVTLVWVLRVAESERVELRACCLPGYLLCQTTLPYYGRRKAPGGRNLWKVEAWGIVSLPSWGPA